MLAEMIEIAKILSADFPFVRVDLYSFSKRILFGELTFYPGNGVLEFYPDDYNRVSGDFLRLPKRNKGQKYIETL